MTTEELGLAASTLWVVIAAVLVLFMQAGFAFLEAGLTRMKNVGHIAAKNALVLGIAAIVYYLVGFGLAFGDDGNGFVGGSGFLPSATLLAVGQALFSWFGAIPAVRRSSSRPRSRPSRSRSSGARWPSVPRLWVYIVFGVAYTLIYSVVSHWVWSGDGWLFAKACRTSPARRSSTTGALAGLAGALLLGPRIGKFVGGKPQAIPGHNMAYTTLGVFILWFGWFGFNLGSTLSVDYGGVGFFAYVALNTNPRRRPA